MVVRVNKDKPSYEMKSYYEKGLIQGDTQKEGGKETLVTQKLLGKLRNMK